MADLEVRKKQQKQDMVKFNKLLREKTKCEAEVGLRVPGGCLGTLQTRPLKRLKLDLDDSRYILFPI